MLILLLSPCELHREDCDEPCLFPDCGAWKLSISRQSELHGGWKEWGWFPNVFFLKAAFPKYSCLFTLMPAHDFLLHYSSTFCVSLYDVCVCVCVCRWPGVTGHAPPTAAVYEEPQQWDADPPEEQCDSLGARGDLHAVLLHALPSDGVGEPQCWALQGYLTDREVRSKHVDRTWRGGPNSSTLNLNNTGQKDK